MLNPPQEGPSKTPMLKDRMAFEDETPEGFHVDAGDTAPETETLDEPLEADDAPSPESVAHAHPGGPDAVPCGPWRNRGRDRR